MAENFDLESINPTRARPGASLHEHQQHQSHDERGRQDALEILRKIQSQDVYHPIHWHPLKKWVIVTIYCLLQVFVSMTSSSYIDIEFLIQEQFGGSSQVVTLGQSLFIAGNAVGPLFLGPLSYARRPTLGIY
jgi:hypothetical protein